MDRTGFARPFLAVTLCALFPLSASAQTTGMLRGLVLDERAAPLAGVSIVVASDSQGVAGRGAVTDHGGSFQIISLPPARDYRLRASVPGFAVVTIPEIEILAGKAVTIRIGMQPETRLLEKIEVWARPQVVNLEEATTETRLSAEFIEALPILGRNYQDLLTLAPGVSDLDGDGNPNIHGARDVDINTLVDGVSTTDPLTGRRGAELNIESIQEIEIKTSGATAEFSRAQGGFVNVITKSGGNEFAGTFKFFWRGSSLDGDGAGIDDPQLHAGIGESGLRDLRFDDFLPFLSLSGPIVKDRAWYFMAHEYIHKEEPVNALNSAFVAGVREFREFAKLTWQPTLNLRLALSVNYDPQEYLNQGLNSFTREESGYASRTGGTVLTLKGSLVLSPLALLETSLSSLDLRPSNLPNLGPDTNGNGTLAFDRNENGFIEASEEDSGEDWDGDGVFDVFEKDLDRDRKLDANEDLDFDGRFTPRSGCEGDLREDIDCDGRLDNIVEDADGDGINDCCPWDDFDDDGHFDSGTEDRNGNGNLDDSPFPGSLYPYGGFSPLPADREYTIERAQGIVSGPYFEEFSDHRRRVTLRQDLSVHVPDRRGAHDLKMGGVVERESYDRSAEARTIFAPRLIRSQECDSKGACTTVIDPASTLVAVMPTERDLLSGASGQTFGLYLQDSYRPAPNVSLGVGMRFDREVARASGYSFFDPAIEGRIYDRLAALIGAEVEQGESAWLADGVRSQGVPSDPIFSGVEGGATQGTAFIREPLRKSIAPRLTRHHSAIAFISGDLGSLYPDIFREDGLDEARLSEIGIVPQQPERFSLTNNNLSPRLSFSWDPRSDGRTKIFANWGRYFDRLFLSTLVAEEGPDDIERYYVYDIDGVSPAGTPNHHAGRVISKSPPSASQVDRGLKTPFSDELSLGFEREIAPEVGLSVTYVNRRFRQQLQDVDVNHVTVRDPATGELVDAIGQILPQASGEYEGGTRVGDGRPDLYIRNPFFNQVLRIGNDNEARYRAVEVALRRRLARRWELQASYSYSRAVGSAEDFQSRLGNDPSTIESEFGYLDYDQRHAVKVNAAIYLPGDWQLGLWTTWGSGLPYSVISRFFALDDADYQQFRTRYGYTQLEPGSRPRFVALRRNGQRNDPTYDMNVSARKALVIGRSSGALSLEISNLLNSDDLRILTYRPHADANAERVTTEAALGQGSLQLDGIRRFGRRFQVGLQVEF